MKRLFMAAAVGIAAAIAGSVRSADFCPERPGQTTPPCVAPKGSITLETALVTWSPDAVQIGQSLLRVGVAARFEAQIGWAGLALANGQAKAGDLTIGALYGLVPWAAAQAYVRWAKPRRAPGIGARGAAYRFRDRPWPASRPP